MKNEEMALLFSEATPYIQKYHGKTLVNQIRRQCHGKRGIEIGRYERPCHPDLLGVRVVLVHGGGPAINQMLNRVGKESKFGQRPALYQ